MALRFRGLVKAARDHRNHMLRGIPECERERFLSSVRRVIDHVISVCKEHGVDVQDLPGPSRNAVKDLRRIADTPLEQLPAPREDGQAARPIRISYVVGGLDNTLKALSRHGGNPDRLAGVFQLICKSVEEIEAICRDNETTPAGMPERSARAYAMTKWLSHRRNFEHYLDQVRLAQQAFDAVSHSESQDPPHPVAVQFDPGRHLWKRRTSSRAHTWHLAVGFLNAGAGDIEDLARVAVSGSRSPYDVLERHREFVDSPDFGELDHELDAQLAGEQFNPRGNVWDLDMLFERLNGRLFENKLSRPKLHWYHSTSRQRFGLYDTVRDAVYINLLLDHEDIPECVPSYVLYHELLHKKHGIVRAGSRRLSHTPEFLDELHCFPEKESAEHWLHRLACGSNDVLSSVGSAPKKSHPRDSNPPDAGRALSRESLVGQALRTSVRSLEKVARNAPCPCGSGKKYKKCCGR